MTRATTIIHDEAAWMRGRAARIAATARKSWEADPENRELAEWLRTAGWDAPAGSFLRNMVESLEEWGRLTPRMVEVVKKIRDERVTKRAENEARWAAERAASEFIGEIGERRVFTAKVVWKRPIETRFGIMTITGMKDAAGNIIVHKGRGGFGEKGEWVSFKATVKAHETYKDAKETIVTRPAEITSAVPADATIH
jgi:hypothetical protein